jgi:tRNA A37 methylthiotransferase MiaB
MSEELQQKMKITLELANQILAYLGRQPYEQVFQLVQSIQEAHKQNFMPQVTSMEVPPEIPPEVRQAISDAEVK